MQQLRGWSQPASAYADDAVTLADIPALIQRIEAVARKASRPAVILVYGDIHSLSRTPHMYSLIARALDPSTYKVVRLDEAFSALRVDDQLHPTVDLGEAARFSPQGTPLNKAACWNTNSYWYAAGTPPYCDISKDWNGHLKWTQPPYSSGIPQNQAGCWYSGSYWYAAGTPPYCDIYKTITGVLK